MKKLFILLLAGSFSLMVWAQTNQPALTPRSREFGIGSDVLYYTKFPQQVIYSGNTWATNAEGKLTCGQIMLNFPAEGSADMRPTNVIAVTNVIIDFIDKKGATNHATGDRLVNDYSVKNGVTNDLFTLSGHAQLSNAKGEMTGEPIIWNNVTGKLTAIGGETHGTMPASSGSNTNSSPLNFLK